MSEASKHRKKNNQQVQISSMKIDEFSVCFFEEEDQFISSRLNGQYDQQSIKSKRYFSTMIDSSNSMKIGQTANNNERTQKSQKYKSRSSTAKYREKKKKQLKQLQQCVKNLDAELFTTDNQLREIKDKIMTRLESNARLNNQVNHENHQIYAELQKIVQQNQNYLQQLIPVDIDKITLLLDTLKTRIGASGYERQAKLNYHFKTIVNTIFPALYRYLLFTAQKNTDIFTQNSEKFSNGSQWKWSTEILQKMSLSNQQKHQFRNFKEKLLKILDDTKKQLSVLDTIQETLKQKQLQIQKIQQAIRMMIHPIESSKIILFCEKYKYKKQLFFWESYPLHHTQTYQKIQEEYAEGRKMIKYQDIKEQEEDFMDQNFI